ncbi:hypothetical protein [Bernardetia sp.]|uniref:hypothetical protein n=1 Tax=Bernardetia sp. TaxID=1937974 RepID=UPI0025B902B0|nr:hypothetical protein [Bernardetia sp.]
MKTRYIFLSLFFVGIFFCISQNGIAQTPQENQKVVHKAVDKMNYEFALAILKRINELDENVKFSASKLKDTTFRNVENLKPRVEAQSLKRIFSQEKLSDNTIGYIYDINFVKQSRKTYSTNDLASSIESLDKIERKILQRTNDFGEQYNKFKLPYKQYQNLKLRLTKIKNSAVSQLKPKENPDTEIKTDTTTKVEEDSTKQEKTEEITKVEATQNIFYQINGGEKKELVGNLETVVEGEKPTYKFGLDVKSTDSIRFSNSEIDTMFLASNMSSPLFLENKNSRFIIDLNISQMEENDTIMWIIFAAIAILVGAYVMYQHSKKKQSEKPRKNQKEVKKDPLSRDDKPIKTPVVTTPKVENKPTPIDKTKEQIEAEKQRLQAILTNKKLSNEQKKKEAKSENILLEVAKNAEVQTLLKKIEELPKEEVKAETTNKANTEETKEEVPSKNTTNYHEPLYVSLSNVEEMGVKSERKKPMSNTIFVVRPYSKGDEQAKEADFLLHSEIKDMAFESIFRSIEKLDHLIEHSTFVESAKKIEQVEKGKLIKEDGVWKVKKRLRVKFS